MNDSDVVMEVSRVGKVIENAGKKNIILHDVSFSLKKGTITAIVGKSGCGKSTLMAIASGIDVPSSGKVIMMGKDYYKMTASEQEKFRNKNIGLLFQNYHLISELTCEENIRMPMCFSNKKTNEANLTKWMKLVGLQGKGRLFPRQMSGGEQQRTAILRAMINEPQFLFADEPTGALDSKTGNTIIRFLVECAHSMKLTILLVTHDMDIAGQCDHVIKMVDGGIEI